MNAKTFIVLLIVIAVGVGGYFFLFGSQKMPGLQVKDADGKVLGLQQLRGDKEYLALVMLIPGCQISQFSSNLIKQHFQRFSPRVAFAGLFYGEITAARKYAEAEELPFPVFGMRDAPDPYAVNELMKLAHASSRVYGGTVFVVDRDDYMLFYLEQEAVRDLPEKLSDLADL
ncbi:MAG: hypothetical protein JXR96_31240 [Deltaproteobacteria bacterium]|nr:hypothetical protein [Deltaproteobacteria bacterium]